MIKPIEQPPLGALASIGIRANLPTIACTLPSSSEPPPTRNIVLAATVIERGERAGEAETQAKEIRYRGHRDQPARRPPVRRDSGTRQRRAVIAIAGIARILEDRLPDLKFTSLKRRHTGSGTQAVANARVDRLSRRISPLMGETTTFWPSQSRCGRNLEMNFAATNSLGLATLPLQPTLPFPDPDQR